jgi:CPA2 family monovalent cation:H+ antiporter-2
MHLDPVMPYLVGSLLAILLLGMILHRFKQPLVIGYLLAGVAMGPHSLRLITDEPTLSRLGAFGVVLLMFFIGMEVSPKRLFAGWRISLVGTLFQVVISTLSVWLIGHWLGWSIERIVLIGFVISISSTAVVLKLLQDWNELQSDTGQHVLGILLVQDLIIIPMLIVIGLLGGENVSSTTLLMQLLGAIFVLGIIGLIFVKDSIRIPLPKFIREDNEMQIFAALVICFGMALITGFLELSAALGAFTAGMMISAAKETQWVHLRLEPFRVIFVAIFFISIGLLVDIHFLREHWVLVCMLVLLALITNTVINAFILKALGVNTHDSFYAGALLSQIGEFSFVLAAVGIQSKIITNFGYQLVIEVISISLLLSPIWIRLVKLSLTTIYARKKYN